MDEEYFRKVALKVQDEMVQIIGNNRQVNDYELIVYKYVFSKELEIPLIDDLAIEVADDGFILYILPDNLPFNKLRMLDDVFEKFEIEFMPNSYNVLKLKFFIK
ncbi:hypothetical protein [Methanobrevibacter sp.]|uniref:hypothetical protein n=1 Tax=Methanobrevibacter sp. TaxID=66852 RepID=UPI0026E00883|nr:hypothetical protein [Methanobrevibacter sp.]MDO5859768.1 hypothetical protein [Methanobrevibacter sp.]